MQQRIEAVVVDGDAALPLHDVDGFFHRDGAAVGAIGGEGVEDVAQGDDACLEPDLVGGQAARVALAVQALVVSAGDQRQFRERA